MYDLPIIQNLIGLQEASISDIKHVYSHEQALMQCSDVLKELDVELISFSNTALASQYIKEQNDKQIKINGIGKVEENSELFKFTKKKEKTT